MLWPSEQLSLSSLFALLGFRVQFKVLGLRLWGLGFLLSVFVALDGSGLLKGSIGVSMQLTLDVLQSSN